eukprot:CAMPEP_0176381574 /NCGR_PEP_ID=MMETSP0126-20121128/31989_1 /TAXON_ID=141414 ORGANISM="Strombidinopsis acuminatum, Strain SPMC142" /NCGR_SAMPLE_ID=MMETSP0126 /ASSEMBLY_ACC=CAM_ASM_000229 /LENGTH=74 /DNA_ID=CAMNT_0017745477 /DNA_START=447 /DNA_END=671 /DNA_ORIENTATION=-
MKLKESNAFAVRKSNQFKKLALNAKLISLNTSAQSAIFLMIKVNKKVFSIVKAAESVEWADAPTFSTVTLVDAA